MSFITANRGNIAQHKAMPCGRTRRDASSCMGTWFRATPCNDTR